LLDQKGFIVSTLRSLKGEGQTPGSIYLPPPKPADDVHSEPIIEKHSCASTSAAADAFYQKLEAASDFAAQAAAAGSRLRQEHHRLAKLRQRLESDYARHGDPEQHKRLGDLLLANIATARRSGNQAMLIDYYAEGAPEIEVLVDENTSLQDEAARYFARYAKAKRARQEITVRLTDTAEKIAVQQQLEVELKQIVAEQNLPALNNFSQAKTTSRPTKPNSQGTKAGEKIPGVRRYLSSDGYEILVGRGARDNDHLTFRVARPQDLWLHAADYPGSHVIVRNPQRGDVPHRTLVEAAQLAAKFSQAGADARVNVHHTQRKFVSRIKGAAPGLVRLSSFKTITAQPGEPVERI
jgi:predicted ribosome quality control (RQC) complex YloA/Tae2 family protein